MQPPIIMPIVGVVNLIFSSLGPSLKIHSRYVHTVMSSHLVTSIPRSFLLSSHPLSLYLIIVCKRICFGNVKFVHFVKSHTLISISQTIALLSPSSLVIAIEKNT